MLESDDQEMRRPFGLSLLTGLYFFFFLISASTFGHPFPFLGHIFQGTAAKTIVFVDCLVCLYLFLGIMQRQLLTWYVLLGYNMFQIINTIVNLSVISHSDLEKFLGVRINDEAMIINNIAAALAILLLTQYIYRNKNYFTNRQLYLF